MKTAPKTFTETKEEPTTNMVEGLGTKPSKGITPAATQRMQMAAGRTEESLRRIHLTLARIEKQMAAASSSPYTLNKLQQDYMALQSRATAMASALHQKIARGSGQEHDEHHDDSHDDHHHEDFHIAEDTQHSFVHGGHLHSDLLHLDHKYDNYNRQENNTEASHMGFFTPIVSMGAYALQRKHEKRPAIIAAMNGYDYGLSVA